MEQIEVLNRYIFRDISGHIYRRTRKADEKSKTDYFSCYIGNCGAKLKIGCGQKTFYGNDHAHSIEDSNQRLDELLFDKYLKELLVYSDYEHTKPDELYEMALKKCNRLEFPDKHKRKKVQIIKSHRSQKKSKQNQQNKVVEGKQNKLFSSCSR